MPKFGYDHPKNIVVYGILCYDSKKEEGDIRVRHLPKNVVGLDILKDWIHDLQHYYDKLLVEVYPTGDEK